MRKTLLFALTLTTSIALGLTSCANDDELEVWMGRNPVNSDNFYIPSFEPIPALPTDLQEEERAQLNELTKDLETMLPQYSQAFVGYNGATYYAGYTDMGLSVYWAAQNLSPAGGKISDKDIKPFKDFFNPDDYKEQLEWHDVQYYLEKAGFVADNSMYPLQMSYNEYIKRMYAEDNTKNIIENAISAANKSHSDAEEAYKKAMKDYEKAVFDYINYLLVVKYGFIAEYETVVAWGTNKFYLWPEYKNPCFEANGNNTYPGNSTDLDAATNLLGAEWHTPTKEQIEELIANCTFKEISVTVQLGYSEIIGYKVTGPSGRSIFLPNYTGSFGDIKLCEYMSSTKTGEVHLGFGDRIYTLYKGYLRDLDDTYYKMNVRPIRTK